MYAIKTVDGDTKGIHSNLEKARQKAHGLIEARGIASAWVVGDDVKEMHRVPWTLCGICNPATCCICGELSGGAMACMGCWDEAIEQGLIPAYGE